MFYFVMYWRHVYIFPLFLLLLLIGSADQCGTGRGGWRRRNSRKMTPLVFRQYIPNVPENTLGASGLAEGRITRQDENFKDLVVNYNPDIVFKDEEGTGADRIMTQRCKDKLNTLAISVENHWPGVKLRVTEGWDEEGHHAKDSLHYEGRAVDITTSDRDRSKYGMLARLAVDAGFDYVFYESRSHIHASVKSDSSIASNYGGCYAANTTVQLKDGSRKFMSHVTEGDVVLSIDEYGKFAYSQVILFFHKTNTENMNFITFITESGKSLTLTANHLLYYSTKESIPPKETKSAVFARNVNIGDYLYILNNSNNQNLSTTTKILKRDKVINKFQQRRKGFYAPLTKHGTIIVNDVYTSCYAHINHHSIAHVCLAPMRWLHSLVQYFSWQHLQERLLHSNIYQQNSNVHWYAHILHSLAPMIIPSSLLYAL